MATLDELVARVERLELQKPAFIAELESLAERCHDVLDQAEAKRARVAARESRANKRAAEAEPEIDFTDRSAVKDNVRRMLRSQGKL